MPPNPSDEQKWGLEFWEHEEGKSRAAKEFEKLESSNPLVFVEVAEKISQLQTTPILHLQKTEDIKKIHGAGLYELRILNRFANVRFLGPIIETTFHRPRLYALLSFYKKSNSTPKNIINNALDRLEEFNLSQNI